MKQTEQYQLSQWESEDRILREDFNANNAKIDAALAEISGKSSFVKLKEVSPSKQVSQYQLDLSDIDWSQWHYVLIDVQIRGSGSFVAYPTGYASSCSTDGWNSNSGYYTMTGQLDCGEMGDTRITIYSCKEPGRMIRVSVAGLRGSCSRQLSVMSKLTFAPMGNGYLNAQSKFTVWGVK